MLRAVALRIRNWYWRCRYRPGRTISVFLVPDVRRDVEVIDTSNIRTGVITVRTRTWNVLYAINGIAENPTFGPVRDTRVRDLWTWSGERWGGTVPASCDDSDAEGAAKERRKV